MLSFMLFFTISVLCAMATIFFALIALIKKENKLFSSLATILSAILTLIAGLNVNVPSPTIYPLDNETHTYFDNAEIIIESGGFDIYYSLDGSNPQNGEKYENPIIITCSATVSARNKFLFWWSDISKSAYKIENLSNGINILYSNDISVLSTTEPIQTPSETPLVKPTPTPTENPTPDPTEELTPMPTPEPIPELISIRDVLEFYSDGINHSKSSITDNIGNIYEGYTYMSASDGIWAELEGGVVYRNDNQYNRFYGVVIISDAEKDDEDCGWVKIYGDNVLLFDTGTMGRGIEPKYFDLDVSLYSEIKIDFRDGQWSFKKYHYPKCYLVDTYFEKK